MLSPEAATCTSGGGGGGVVDHSHLGPFLSIRRETLKLASHLLCNEKITASLSLSTFSEEGDLTRLANSKPRPKKAPQKKTPGPN